MTTPTHPTRAQQLFSRSRGKPARPMPVPGLAEAQRVKAEQAKALDVATANRPLHPPHICDIGQASKRCRRCGKGEVAT